MGLAMQCIDLYIYVYIMLCLSWHICCIFALNINYFVVIFIILFFYLCCGCYKPLVQWKIKSVLCFLSKFRILCPDPHPQLPTHLIESSYTVLFLITVMLIQSWDYVMFFYWCLCISFSVSSIFSRNSACGGMWQ